MRPAKLQVRRDTRAMARVEPPLDPPDEDQGRYWATHEIVKDLADAGDELFHQLTLERFFDRLEVTRTAISACKFATPGESAYAADFYKDRLFRMLYEASLEVAEQMRKDGDWTEPAPMDDEHAGEVTHG